MVRCVKTIVPLNQHNQRLKLPVAVLVVAQVTVQTRVLVHVIIRAVTDAAVVVGIAHRTVPVVAVLRVLITADTRAERTALQLAQGYVHHVMDALDALDLVLKSVREVVQMSALVVVERTPVPMVAPLHALDAPVDVMDVAEHARDALIVVKAVHHVQQNALPDVLDDVVVPVSLSVVMAVRQVVIQCVRTAVNRPAQRHVTVLA